MSNPVGPPKIVLNSLVHRANWSPKLRCRSPATADQRTQRGTDLPVRNGHALHDKCPRDGYRVHPFPVRVEDLQRPDVVLLPQNRETLVRERERERGFVVSCRP